MQMFAAVSPCIRIAATSLAMFIGSKTKPTPRSDKAKPATRTFDGECRWGLFQMHARTKTFTRNAVKHEGRLRARFIQCDTKSARGRGLTMWCLVHEELFSPKIPPLLVVEFCKIDIVLNGQVVTDLFGPNVLKFLVYILNSADG